MYVVLVASDEVIVVGVALVFTYTSLACFHKRFLVAAASDSGKALSIDSHLDGGRGRHTHREHKKQTPGQSNTSSRKVVVRPPLHNALTPQIAGDSVQPLPPPSPPSFSWLVVELHLLKMR